MYDNAIKLDSKYVDAFKHNLYNHYKQEILFLIYKNTNKPF